MVKLNRFQRWMLTLIGLNPKGIVAKEYDVEQAHWSRYHAGKKQGAAEERTKLMNCRSCVLYQQATKGIAGVEIIFDPRIRQAPYEQKTDPLKSPKYIEQIHTQHDLPKLPHKYHLMQHSEPPPGATLSRVPTWLR